MGSSPVNGRDPSGLCPRGSHAVWRGGEATGGKVLTPFAWSCIRDALEQEVSDGFITDFLGGGGSGGPQRAGGPLEPGKTSTDTPLTPESWSKCMTDVHGKALAVAMGT